MSASNTVKILNQNYYDSLINNRSILIENVIISENVVQLCSEKNVISGDNLTKIGNSQNNTEKIDCIIESLKMKKSKFFSVFCEILMMSGYPLIAEILNGSVSSDNDADLKDIWDELPSLKKSLTPKEKETLLKYINNKIKEENVKIILSQPKENQRRASLAKLTQVEQTWKFQKEIKGKELEKDQLKNQLNSIEEKLLEKQKQLNSLVEDYKIKKQQQDEQIAVAAKFNTANDKEIQRIEFSIVQFKNMVSKISSKIRSTLENSSDSFSKLIRESSESNIRKFDLEKQLEIFESLVTNLIVINENFVEEMKLFENLKTEVKSIQKIIETKTNFSSSESLTDSFQNYEISNNNRINFLYEQIEIQENFIFGLIPEENIPEKYRNIRVPSNERTEFTEIISELKTKIKYLEALLAAKEKEYGFYIQEKAKINSSTIIEIIPEETNENRKNKETNSPLSGENNQSKLSGENNQSKLSGENNQSKFTKTIPNIPFSYSSKHTKRMPNSNPILKQKKSNFLKANVVSFL